ncbi:putative bacteriophage protein [Salmonella enterica subsp. enterica serovar Typhi]|nr:putative bacteriophage protein [Salmonella enterica subsp. enterica serovar Typhi]
MPVMHNCFLELARESLQHNGEQWTRNADESPNDFYQNH